MGILYNELLGFKGTHNNEKICVAIANEIVNCSFIQASHKVCFTNYNFEIPIISSFVVCAMCYLHQKYFLLEVIRYFTKQTEFRV